MHEFTREQQKIPARLGSGIVLPAIISAPYSDVPFSTLIPCS